MQLRDLIVEVAPQNMPRTRYGMPAYALDDDATKLASFAITKVGASEEPSVTELLPCAIR